MSAGVAQAVTSSTGCAASLRTCSSYASPWTLRPQPGRLPWCKTRRAYPNIRAVSAPEETNEEEKAPEKEMQVGKRGVELAVEENTKVSGNYPPKNKKWTGYVEKDTAGQTNIYSVEPIVYVAESAISSGGAGDSSEGSNLTVTVSASLALGLVLAAGIVLQRVGSSSNLEPTYDGPSLSFYIRKFKPSATMVEAKVAPETEAAPEVSDSVEAAFGSYQSPEDL